MDDIKKKKRERILEKTKPNHLIDACVLIAASGEDKSEISNHCSTYLHGLGHKYNGFITLPNLGEIFLKMTRLPISPIDVRFSCFKYICDLFDKGYLNIKGFPKEKECKNIELMKIDYSIEHDDACHLSHAIHHKFRYFVTIDEKLTEEKYNISRQRIYNKFKLEIVTPEQMIKQLNI